MSSVAETSGRSYHVHAKACACRSAEKPVQYGGCRRKRRTSLLLGGCSKMHHPRTRRHTTTVEQVYRAVPWKAVQVGVRGPRGLYETVSTYTSAWSCVFTSSRSP
ncbi:hypothetical protein HPB52_020390 [Rhipicephalus sanguineus]|uniref:Uncharacterized protein n=1 Tax=Rhipicephalus sanguineus TaxID=34632 RepID=A0A9D4SV50_RHISA|nr:hypothetical protein HPB52_020390 [Rhipicephalus sanguineus]